MESDICIIGAGPAGMMAASAAADVGANLCVRPAQTRRSAPTKIVVIESNTTAGRKLLLTGRGRCNLTHTGTIDEFIRAFKPFDKFVRHCIYEFPPQSLREFFRRRGLETIEEADGCVFPKTQRSSDVKRILLDEIKKYCRGEPAYSPFEQTHRSAPTIQIFYGKKVQSVKKEKDLFIVSSKKFNIEAKSVIIATGGVSWPQTGSTGDGFRFAQDFGHKIIEPKACVVPLVTAEKFCSSLAGVGITNVEISCKIENKKISASGPMIFTHKGIGGPAVFDLSRFITDKLNKNKIEISIDLLPAIDSQELDKKLADYFAQNAKQNVVSVLSQFLPKAAAQQICLINPPSARPRPLVGRLGQIGAGQIDKQTRRLLVGKLKNLGLTITSTESIEKATVTRGGIDITQIDSETMQSKLCSGLFFAGEVIDVDGPCGGYNLQFAFSSGFLAGKSTAIYSH
ncbi:MAG: NAD(P)/FAD-dependent oxidoreductase [Sedimentisphaerales bacterium]